MMVSTFGTITEGAKVNTALEEMSNIKNAVAGSFFYDLGFIPEDPDARPWHSTRYLCLSDDRDNPGMDPDPGNNPESNEIWKFLRFRINPDDPDNEATKSAAKSKLAWNRYQQKGWRGPYMGGDAMFRLKSAPDVWHYFPLVASPWVDKCEKLAEEAEERGAGKEAERLRRGQYYLIVTDKDGDGHQIKNTARIISFGANCRDDGSYHKDYVKSDPQELTGLNDLRKPNINDLDNPDYYPTGDDLVVFIFGGGVMRKGVESIN